MRPCIQRMALQARLHPNRENRFPKMLLGIAEDFLRHCLSQRIVRFIMDRNVSHGDAPQSYGTVEAVMMRVIQARLLPFRDVVLHQTP